LKDGAAPAAPRFIPQMEPSFDEREVEHIVQYMREGGWVTEFKKTEAFADMVAAYTGARYCSIVSNGTVSLTIALLACGVAAGDEVIVPDYTMVATPNSVVLAGATPVFADVDRSTLCLDLEHLRARLTSRTKAVILVTINGRYPHDLEGLVAFCRERGLKLIEDAAQSLGSSYKGRHLGRFGDVGSFSFSAPKIITTGQGGALITDDPAVFDRIKKIRDFGRATPGNDCYLMMGWNFKFTDIQAVIGIEQMKKLDGRVKRKKEMYRQYRERLRKIEQVELIPTDLEDTAPWFVDVLVERRAELIAHLRSKSIGSREFYPALHGCPVYRREESCPVAEEVAARGLWLPSSVKLTDDDIDRVCAAIQGFWE
jgi:perosamine synthetase